MQASWLLARNTLAGRRGRTILMIIAVALAASLVVAVSSSIRSAQASVEWQLVRYLGASDARIVHASGARFDSMILQQARGWTGVEAATGRSEGAVTLIRADGAEDPETGRPLRATPRAIGVDFAMEPMFRELPLESGAWPTDAHQVLLDPQTAEALDAVAGTRLQVQRFGPPIELIVSGVYERQRLGALQRPRMFMDHTVLTEASGTRDELSRVYLILHEDVDLKTFCADHNSELPELLKLEPAEMVRAGFDGRVRASKIALTVASALTFLCATFIIITGMTTAVTEKEREMGLLRAIGATRGQLFVSQIIVGLSFGLLGAVLGTPIGVLLARSLVWYFSDMLPGGFQIHPMGVSLAAIGSVCAGLAGALYPAWFASRVSPLRVMAHRADPVQLRHLLGITAVAAALLVAHLVLLTFGDDERRFWNYTFIGLPFLFTAWFLLGVPVLQGVTRLTSGLISRLLRLPADMLASSVLATPFRHGLTAGALMVGMALLVDAWASGLALQKDWLHQIRFADGFAYSATGIDQDAQDRISELPFAERISAIGRLPVRLADRQVFGLDGVTSRSVICIGFEPESFFDLNSIDWIQGDAETALPRLTSGEGLLVAERFLTAKGLGVGDSIALEVGRHIEDFEILGVISSAGLDLATPLFGIGNAYMELSISCVFIDRAVVSRRFDVDAVHILQIDLADDITDEEASEQITNAAPGVIFRSGRMILDTLQGVANASLAVQSTIAFAALVLASIAVGNVIAANVQARRFEYGVLRAIGASRGTVVRLVLGEGMVLALTGAALGTGLGFELAWMDSMHMKALAGLPVGVAIPVGPVALGWLIQVTITVIAAAVPARGLATASPADLIRDI